MSGPDDEQWGSLSLALLAWSPAGSFEEDVAPLAPSAVYREQ